MGGSGRHARTSGQDRPRDLLRERADLNRVRLTLRRAARAVDEMVAAPVFEVEPFEEWWETFLDRIERVWKLAWARRHLHTPWAAELTEFAERRKSGMLQYVLAARNTIEHTIEPALLHRRLGLHFEYSPGHPRAGETIGPQPDGRMFISANGVMLVAEPAEWRLLPAVDSRYGGRTVDPPARFLTAPGDDQALPAAGPIKLAHAALESYTSLVDTLESIVADGERQMNGASEV